MKIRERLGFTLIELVVTCLVIGVLASYAVPQYLKTVENGKFDDAVGLSNQIGMTNRMFALDHGGSYVYGQFPAAATGCGCTGATCNGYAITNGTPFAGACALVCCNYLADQNWKGKAYNFYACDASGASGYTTGGCNTGFVSAADRNASGIAPYTGWQIQMQVQGQILSSGAQVPVPVY
jgi:prepilin-type N-terminal cleavage/methylation domain-containing protein